MKYSKECGHCGTLWLIDISEDPVIMEPYPHVNCPKCGNWIPLF